MIKQAFCVVFATALLASASALAQGTPVQGTDTTKVKVVTDESATMMQSETETKVNANADKGEQMVPAEEKTKMDRKGRKVKKTTTYR